MPSQFIPYYSFVQGDKIRSHQGKLVSPLTLIMNVDWIMGVHLFHFFELSPIRQLLFQIELGVSSSVFKICVHGDFHNLFV